MGRLGVCVLIERGCVSARHARRKGGSGAGDWDQDGDDGEKREERAEGASGPPPPPTPPPPLLPLPLSLSPTPPNSRACPPPIEAGARSLNRAAPWGARGPLLGDRRERRAPETAFRGRARAELKSCFCSLALSSPSLLSPLSSPPSLLSLSLPLSLVKSSAPLAVPSQWRVGRPRRRAWPEIEDARTHLGNGLALLGAHDDGPGARDRASPGGNTRQAHLLREHGGVFVFGGGREAGDEEEEEETGSDGRDAPAC